MSNFRDKANLIWSIADLLRGRYKQADYGKVILPFTVACWPIVRLAWPVISPSTSPSIVVGPSKKSFPLILVPGPRYASFDLFASAMSFPFPYEAENINELADFVHKKNPALIGVS